MNHVDLAFSLRGNLIPRDHGYALYGALSRALPELHEAKWIGVHSIDARRLGKNTLALRPRGTLTLRVPVERIGTCLPLAGKTLDITGNAVTIGVPTAHPLVPAPTLDARLVVIKLTDGIQGELASFDAARFKARFEEAARRQLERLGITATLETCGRSSITVGGRRVLGCAVRVSGLTPEQSLALQTHGLGGKRTMGCGIFRPARARE